MKVTQPIRSQNIDLPAQPQVLARLTQLLARREQHLGEVAALVSSDMALAAAVLQAVNSPLFNLAGEAGTVVQALQHLGTREVAALTLRLGLQAQFPPAAPLHALWQRSARRGALMGTLAEELGVDPWTAHAAGLFEECGKALLFRHAPQDYEEMLAGAADDTALLALERDAFGIGHDALGARMCERWGLAGEAAQCVRHHVLAQASLQLPGEVQARPLCALSVLADCLLNGGQDLALAADIVGAQMQWDADAVLAAVQRAQGLAG